MPGQLLRIARMLSILLLTCLPVSACTAQDTAAVRDRNWVSLGAGAESRMYLDSSRVEVADGEHTVWLWVDFTEPSTMPGDSTMYWGVQSRHRLDCAGQRVDDLALLVLDREGAPLDAGPFEGTRWKTFADHPGSNLFSLACRWLGRHRPARG